jgi:plastocyanin domain-containing protein
MRHAVALIAALAFTPALAAEPNSAAAPTKAAGAAQAGRQIEITVTETGFEPREIKLKKGEAATLVFTRKTEHTCITAIDIPAEDVKKLKLPLNQPVALTITPKKAGVEAFHCTAMAMGNGKLIVEE